jgi:hypothetical protein
MATDRKISALTSLTGANAADGDLLHIVDIDEAADADKNKSITCAELKSKFVPTLLSYAPTHSAGWGTMDHATFNYTLNGVIMTIWGEQKNGSPSAVDLTISIPSGFKIHTSIAIISHVGWFQRDVVGTARYIINALGGDTTIGVGRIDAVPGPYVVMQGDDGMGTNEKQSFSATFPVELV